MLFPVYAILVVALVFYLILPGIFALASGAAWSRFRLRFLSLWTAPLLRHGSARTAGESFRFFGRIEALEGRNRLWVRGETTSALVDFSRSPLYVLAPRPEASPRGRVDEAGGLERLRWSRVHSFSEGTAFFVCGTVGLEDGRPVFMEGPGQPLIAISWDGEGEDFPLRVLAAARSRNEFFNPSTFVVWSIGIGILSLILLYYTKRNLLPTLRFLAALPAFMPLLAILPPGGIILFLGGLGWRRCLSLRMRRDLALLEAGAEAPIRRQPYGAILKRLLLNPVDRRIAGVAGLSLLAVLASILLNAVLAFLLYRVF